MCIRDSRTVWKPQPHVLVADWLGLMELARGESCRSGQSRGPAAPAKDRVFSLDFKSFRIHTTPTTPGRKRRSPGSIPPRTVWKPQPHWVIADWLGLKERARARVAPLANVEVPPHMGRLWSYPRIRNPSVSLHLTPITWGRKRGSPGSILPRTVWKPLPHWLVADWLGLMEPADGEGFLSVQVRGCAAHGEVKVPSPDQKFFHISTIPTNREPRR